MSNALRVRGCGIGRPAPRRGPDREAYEIYIWHSAQEDGWRGQGFRVQGLKQTSAKAGATCLAKREAAERISSSIDG